MGRKQSNLNKAASIISVLDSKGSQKDLVNKSHTINIDKVSQ
jgi:hypothetical protein